MLEHRKVILDFMVWREQNQLLLNTNKMEELWLTFVKSTQISAPSCSHQQWAGLVVTSNCLLKEEPESPSPAEEMEVRRSQTEGCGPSGHHGQHLPPLYHTVQLLHLKTRPFVQEGARPKIIPACSRQAPQRHSMKPHLPRHCAVCSSFFFLKIRGSFYIQYFTFNSIGLCINGPYLTFLFFS